MNIEIIFFCRLLDNVSFEEGVCVEFFFVGLYGCWWVGIILGYKVFVMGVGFIGLCVMLSVKVFGVFVVCMIG